MLTDTKLRSLKPREASFRLADTNGLCIEVRPTGSKIWRYRYRFAGKANMLTVGEYPAVSLAEARAERDKARVLLKGGADPAQVARIRRAAQMERAGNTFAESLWKYLGLGDIPRPKTGPFPSSVEDLKRCVEHRLFYRLAQNVKLIWF